MDTTLDQFHRRLSTVIDSIDEFPLPTTIGRRDEKSVVEWLLNLRKELRAIDDDMFVAAGGTISDALGTRVVILDDSP